MRMKKITMEAIRIVFYMIKENRRVSAEELMENTGAVRTEINEILEKLITAGLVKTDRRVKAQDIFMLTHRGLKVTVYEVIRRMEGDMLAEPKEPADPDEEALYRELMSIDSEYIQKLKTTRIISFIHPVYKAMMQRNMSVQY